MDDGYISFVKPGVAEVLFCSAHRLEQNLKIHPSLIATYDFMQPFRVATVLNLVQWVKENSVLTWTVVYRRETVMSYRAGTNLSVAEFVSQDDIGKCSPMKCPGFRYCLAGSVLGLLQQCFSHEQPFCHPLPFDFLLSPLVFNNGRFSTGEMFYPPVAGGTGESRGWASSFQSRQCIVILSN